MTGAGDRGDGLPAVVEVLAGARTDDAVFVVGPDYRVVYWDPRAEFLTGLAGADVVGRLLYEAVAGEREDGTPFCHCGCPVMRLARAGLSVPSHEARLYSPSGKKRWVGVTVLSVDAEEGPYLIHLLRDSQRMHETLEMARGLIRRSNGDTPGVTGTAPELTARQLEVLRLRNEIQLGFKLVKWIKGIEFVEHYSEVGGGYGGYNEDHEFFGYRQSI